MTNYTTLKLTDAEVQAIYSAINFYEISYEHELDEELEGTSVPATLKAHQAIEAKLAKQGWA